MQCFETIKLTEICAEGTFLNARRGYILNVYELPLEVEREQAEKDKRFIEWLSAIGNESATREIKNPNVTEYFGVNLIDPYTNELEDQFIMEYYPKEGFNNLNSFKELRSTTQYDNLLIIGWDDRYLERNGLKYV